jgi:hypothetical protein
LLKLAKATEEKKLVEHHGAELQLQKEKYDKEREV